MKKMLNLVLLTIALVVFTCHFASGKALKPSQSEEALKVSNKLKSKKIAIVQFFPLPEKVVGSRYPHERVFTGEFYTAKPDDGGNVEDIFIPNDYLEIIGNNFNVFRIKYGLDIELIDNIAKVGADADLVLIGTVLDFSADSGTASVEMAVRIIDGKSLDTIKEQVVRNTIKRESKNPITYYHPFHTLGSLGSDFYLERYLLNLACYQSIADLLNIINENVR